MEKKPCQCVMDGCELAYLMSETTRNILASDQMLQVYAAIDSRSLYEHLGTTKQAENKRLRLEISALREMVSEEDIRLIWVPGAKQLSNALTKKGASWNLLRQVLLNGMLPSAA